MSNNNQAKLLVIDNYDSFTYNLVQMFRQYPLDINVYRCDCVTLAMVDEYRPDYVLISPGPKNPDHSGISIPLIRSFHQRIPILGVCLGMQCINAAFGGETVRAPKPTHGKTSSIHHDHRFLFENLPTPFTAARYHSLMIRPAGDELTITAKSEDGVIMGISHRRHPLHGVQFHPESFLTQYGFDLVENFLKLGKLNLPVQMRKCA